MYVPRIAVCLCLFAAPLAVAEMKAGVGTAVITPKESIWMSGYASRTEPSDGKIHDIYAKALAIEDADGVKSVVVTSDLIGLSADISARVAAAAKEKHGLDRGALMLTASHTHCGPVVRGNLMSMYALDEDQSRRIVEYADFLVESIGQAISDALADLEPAELYWTQGEATFGKNRREYTLGGVGNGINPIGPVDHDVPVLIAKRPDGSTKGILFGYACHNTTLGFQQICGDYAGFAQVYIQERVSGATALFASGCGGDVNPQPRRTLELAQQHGAALGQAVLSAAYGDLTPVDGPIRMAFEETALPLSEPPTKEALEAQLQNDDVYIQRRAKWLLDSIEKEGPLKTTYPYPVQVWRLGDAVQLTALGGEAVVDYALRIKYELGQDNQFVIAYANDVMAYIPSLRILREGGYEGESSMIYYGLYGPWAPEVENTVMESVRRLTEQAGGTVLNK